MADPSGGLVKAASFAFKSSIDLVQLINEYKNHPQRVQDLLREISTLSDVLRLLTEIATTELDLTTLEGPLARCTKACKEFGDEIGKCASRYGEDRTTFKGWARIKYMGDGIDDFKQMLASYKSTFEIALNVANLRKAHLTLSRLESYQGSIQTAMVELNDRLALIDEKLEPKADNAANLSDAEKAVLQAIKDDKADTKTCLDICTKLSVYIVELQRKLSSSGGSLSGEIMNDGLQGCKDVLKTTAGKLEQNMLSVLDQFMAKSKATQGSEEEAAELARLRDEWVTIRHCIDFCYKAADTVQEKINDIDNYAVSDDAIQWMVSTDGTVLNGKNRAYGARPRQIGGHYNDPSIQQISRDLKDMHMRTPGINGVPFPDDVRTQSPSRATASLNKENKGSFSGPGVTLMSKSDPDLTSSKDGAVGRSKRQ